jgi:hypothetical protein
MWGGGHCMCESRTKVTRSNPSRRNLVYFRTISSLAPRQILDLMYPPPPRGPVHVGGGSSSRHTHRKLSDGRWPQTPCLLTAAENICRCTVGRHVRQHRVAG